MTSYFVCATLNLGRKKSTGTEPKVYHFIQQIIFINSKAFWRIMGSYPKQSHSVFCHKSQLVYMYFRRYGAVQVFVITGWMSLKATLLHNRDSLVIGEIQYNYL